LDIGGLRNKLSAKVAWDDTAELLNSRAVKLGSVRQTIQHTIQQAMSRKTLSSFLFAAAIVSGVLALVTLAPHSNPMLSDLGYHTLCPFAPWSTLTLLFLGWLAWIVRGYVNQQDKPAGQQDKPTR
jgi:hypothetical protein